MLCPRPPRPAPLTCRSDSCFELWCRPWWSSPCFHPAGGRDAKSWAWMGSQRLKKDHTRLWALPSPSWIQLFEGLWGHGVRGQPNQAPWDLRWGSYLLNETSKMPGIWLQPSSPSLHVYYVLGERPRDSPEVHSASCRYRTGCGKGRGMPSLDCLCFSQAAMYPICNLKH